MTTAAIRVDDNGDLDNGGLVAARTRRRLCGVPKVSMLFFAFLSLFKKNSIGHMAPYRTSNFSNGER